MFEGIDFYSDTMTQPTDGMRQAMANAVVGDEQRGEDPTTRKLEARVAELLGKTSALFFPSATMANEVAIKLQCLPGEELLAANECHLFFAETGGPAVHAQVMAKPIETASGIFDGDDVRRYYRYAKGSHYPVSKLISVENTTNLGGGLAWPLDKLKSVIQAAKELDMYTHLDGARLFNAAQATSTTVKQLAEGFDTVTICLSKGLGCPVGAILAFDESRFVQVRRLKQLMGGALRQSGILAAAGLYALDNHVLRLKDDHDNAKRLAEGLGEDVKGLEVETTNPSTNMVYFKWTSQKATSFEFHNRCQIKGLRFSEMGKDRFRAVTHLNLTRQDIEKAISIVKEVSRQIYL